MIEVLPNGTPVGFVNNPSLAGVITMIRISGLGDSVDYYVSWWEGKARKEDWFQPYELVTGIAVEKQQIGFAQT